jgi:hypothetical protein
MPPTNLAIAPFGLGSGLSTNSVDHFYTYCQVNTSHGCSQTSKNVTKTMLRYITKIAYHKKNLVIFKMKVKQMAMVMEKL